MSQEGPKLYTHKPKKAQMKAKSSASPTAPTPSPSPSPTPKPTSSSASVSMSAAEAAAASYKVGGGTPPPLSPPPNPQPPKESFARRYKFLWPLLLTVNLGVGAYLFMRTSKEEDTGRKEEASTYAPSTPVSSSPTTAPATEKPTSLPAIPVAVTVAPREPIPENEQRELSIGFWKRKGNSNQNIQKRRSALMKKKPFSNKSFDRIAYLASSCLDSRFVFNQCVRLQLQGGGSKY